MGVGVGVGDAVGVGVAEEELEGLGDSDSSSDEDDVGVADGEALGCDVVGEVVDPVGTPVPTEPLANFSALYRLLLPY